jgi:hypothetical protein
MTFLTLLLRAYLSLLYFELFLVRSNFKALYRQVRLYPQSRQMPCSDTIHRICAAMDMACIWYWRQVLCLQRSAATTCLLRRYGVPAQMVIGAQQVPFKAHAWVEVNGQVVNDKPYMSEMYGVLDRC